MRSESGEASGGRPGRPVGRRRVDCDDIEAFVLAIANPEGYATTHGLCSILRGDFNGDRLTNFDDIEGFVACLIAGGCS